jgi:hypothetical protein
MDTVDPTSSDPDKLKFAVNLLSGRALTWWRHHIQTSATTINTFTELRDALYKEFVDVDHINKLRDSLDNLV